MRRLKQPEAENEKLVAERDLEIEIMKEINAKNGERAGSPFPGGVRGGKGAVAKYTLNEEDIQYIVKYVSELQ